LDQKASVFRGTERLTAASGDPDVYKRWGFDAGMDASGVTISLSFTPSTGEENRK
jgi:hypothetical protein